MIPEVATDKIQAFPVAKVEKELRLLLVYWVTGDLLFPLCTDIKTFICLGLEGKHRGLGC